MEWCSVTSLIIYLIKLGISIFDQMSSLITRFTNRISYGPSAICLCNLKTHFASLQRVVHCQLLWVFDRLLRDQFRSIFNWSFTKLTLLDQILHFTTFCILGCVDMMRRFDWILRHLTITLKVIKVPWLHVEAHPCLVWSGEVLLRWDVYKLYFLSKVEAGTDPSCFNTASSQIQALLRRV